MDELFWVDGNFYGRDTKRIPRPCAFPRLAETQPSVCWAGFAVLFSLLPLSPPKRTSFPRSVELLLFDNEHVQSHIQPNYCFWRTPPRNVVCHAVLLLISQMNTFLFFESPLSKSRVNSIWTKRWGRGMASSKPHATAALGSPQGTQTQEESFPLEWRKPYGVEFIVWAWEISGVPSPCHSTSVTFWPSSDFLNSHSNIDCLILCQARDLRKGFSCII